MSRRRMIVLDVDETFIREEQMDLLAQEAGTASIVSALTAASVDGTLDFSESLRRRAQALAGLPTTAFGRAVSRIRLAIGAETLLTYAAERDWPVYLVSGGFHEIIDPLVADLSIAGVRANRFEIVAGRLTGRVIEPILDRAAKETHLVDLARREGIAIEDTVAVGDGDNDIAMLRRAGLGAAMGGTPAVRDAADVHLVGDRLDELLAHL